MNESVNFPSIIDLANRNFIDLEKLLEIRKKAKRFRKWLQEISERDKDAIISYHTEVAKETGLTKFGKSMLNLFGDMGTATIGTYLGYTANDIQGVILAGLVTSNIHFVLRNILDKKCEWKPIIFGEWLKGRLSNYTLPNQDG